jgi:hypothetical protein
VRNQDVPGIAEVNSWEFVYGYRSLASTSAGYSPYNYLNTQGTNQFLARPYVSIGVASGTYDSSYAFNVLGLYPERGPLQTTGCTHPFCMRGID